MISDKITKQEGGENSTNLQGQTIIVNQGITYQDAKAIAVDVFKSNYLELSQKAAEVAKSRAEELVDDFLNKMKERSPGAINSMEEPGMQYAIFTAQKEYARTGDKDLSDMLVDILVDRAAQKERSLKQIVLDESLSIVPKLTLGQLDTLTIIFVLRYTQNFSVKDLASLKKYLQKYVEPFVSSLSNEPSLYQHLAFTGAASISIGVVDIEQVFASTYAGLFCKGFTKEEFEEFGMVFDRFKHLFVPCLNDSTKLQVAVMNLDEFETKLPRTHLTQDDIMMIKSFSARYQMPANNIKEIVLSQGDFMKSLYDVWVNSEMKSVSLTSVGIAIASANLRTKAGISLDLGIWIK